MNGKLERLLDDLEAKEVIAHDRFHDLTVAAYSGHDKEYIVAHRAWKIACEVTTIAAMALAAYKLEG